MENTTLFNCLLEIIVGIQMFLSNKLKNFKHYTYNFED